MNFSFERKKGKKPERDIKELLKALQNRNPDTRQRSLEALGIREEEAVTLLIEALKNRNETIRSESVRALTILRDERAVTPLIQMLRDGNESPYLREEAARTLGAIRDERAVEPMINLLEEEWMGEDTLMSQAKEPLEFFIQILEKEWVQEDIVEALGRIRGQDVVESLILAIDERNSSIRKAAAALLKELFAFYRGERGFGIDSIPFVQKIGTENRRLREIGEEVLEKMRRKI